MKKIIFSSYDHIFNPYYHGGGAKALHEIAQRLAAYYEVTILTASYFGCENQTVDGVAYRYLGPVIRHPQLGQLIFQACLPLAIKRETFDLWIENFTPPFSTAFLPLFTSKPVVGLVHLLSGKTMAEKYHFPLFPLIEKTGLQHYQYLIALTVGSKSQISDLNSKAQVFVIPNGIETNIQLHSSSKRSHWLYLGRIDFEQKGLELLVSAFSKIAQSHPWKLFIAGSGSTNQVKRLHQLIVKSKVGNRIVYLGELYGLKKQKLLVQAGALILPSKYETQPLVVLEGFAAKCPVIISDIFDLDWIPHDCCWKVQRTIHDFSEQLLRFYRHRNSQQHRTKTYKAKQFIKDFDWKKVTNHYRHIIDQLTTHSTSEKGIVCVSS